MNDSDDSPKTPPAPSPAGTDRDALLRLAEMLAGPSGRAELWQGRRLIGFTGQGDA